MTSAAVWAACALVPLVLLVPASRWNASSGAFRDTRRDGRQRDLPGPASSDLAALAYIVVRYCIMGGAGRQAVPEAMAT